MGKKILSRDEFESMRGAKAKEMVADTALQNDALDVLVRADKHHWIHQSNWFGEPVLQLPQDMFAFQEIIFKTRPDFIIEVGVAWGGSLLFNATICEALGHGEVIGIDVYIPDDLKDRLADKGSISQRIHLIEGSSVEMNTVDKVRDIVGNSTKTFVILDSHHTKDHVSKELELYSSFVEKGCYLLCGDTIVDRIPEQEHRTREWGPGNNPMNALDDFLKTHKRFESDAYFDSKLLFTCNPKGFLLAVEDEA